MMPIYDFATANAMRRKPRIILISPTCDEENTGRAPAPPRVFSSILEGLNLPERDIEYSEPIEWIYDGIAGPSSLAAAGG